MGVTKLQRNRPVPMMTKLLPSKPFNIWSAIGRFLERVRWEDEERKYAGGKAGAERGRVRAGDGSLMIDRFKLYKCWLLGSVYS